MPTLVSCMFLDIVVLSVQEYNKNPKNKIRKNKSFSFSPHIYTPHTQIHTRAKLHIHRYTERERDTHTHKAALSSHLLYFPLAKTHDLNFLKSHTPPLGCRFV